MPDYDWEQDAMTGAVFDYHFANVAGIAAVVGDQVSSPLLAVVVVISPLKALIDCE